MRDDEEARRLARLLRRAGYPVERNGAHVFVTAPDVRAFLFVNHLRP